MLASKHQSGRPLGKFIGAVPFAINYGGKFLFFRPFYGEGVEMQIGPSKTVDKGFYFKMNTSIDIKLVRYTFEENGLVDCPEDKSWCIMWTTSSIKPSDFQNLLKH